MTTVLLTLGVPLVSCSCVKCIAAVLGLEKGWNLRWCHIEQQFSNNMELHMELFLENCKPEH